MTPLLWSRGEPAREAQAPDRPATPTDPSSALQRLWRGFMAARYAVAAVLLLLQLLSYLLGQPIVWPALGLSAGYLVVALLVSRMRRFAPPIRSLSTTWLATIGIDLALFSALQLMQVGSINYTPLFALPVLMGAVLGTVTVGLGTTAAVTLLLLADAGWHWLGQPGDASSRFVQAALTGTGLFMVALLAHELSRRLAREEELSQISRSTAEMQAQVNDLVIEALSEGVLVIDAQCRVHAANPAADAILGQGLAQMALPFALKAHPAWHALATLADQTFGRGRAQSQEIPVAQPHGAAREVRVRTRLTPVTGARSDSLCVMFLQDLRELEARIRTEKLAAMGRMSAAVAHEIRNPLAAITQASALLSEDLSDPAHRKLVAMVEQNAQRLARIVDDVLDVARARQQRPLPLTEQVMLDRTVGRLVDEWMQQTGHQGVLLMLDASQSVVDFDAEHMRRILVNLLDNAARYASARGDAIHLATHGGTQQPATLRVWSDGAALDPAVQRHLFEPFFSSESRSSGLGLFLCRELCERHGATIGYQRRALSTDGPEGNEFFIVFTGAGKALTQ